MGEVQNELENKNSSTTKDEGFLSRIAQEAYEHSTPKVYEQSSSGGRLSSELPKIIVCIPQPPQQRERETAEDKNLPSNKVPEDVLKDRIDNSPLERYRPEPEQRRSPDQREHSLQPDSKQTNADSFMGRLLNRLEMQLGSGNMGRDVIKQYLDSQKLRGDFPNNDNKPDKLV